MTVEVRAERAAGHPAAALPDATPPAEVLPYATPPTEALPYAPPPAEVLPDEVLPDGTPPAEAPPVRARRPGYLLRRTRSPQIPGPRAAGPLIRLSCRPVAEAGPGIRPAPDPAPDSGLRQPEQDERSTAAAAPARSGAARLAEPAAPELEPGWLVAEPAVVASPSSSVGGRTSWLIAAAATVVAALLAVWISSVLIAKPVAHQQQLSTAADSATLAAAWAASALPAGSSLIADPTMRNALIAQGFKPLNLIPFNDAAGSLRSGYLMATGAVRAAAAEPAGQLLTRSRSMASFGTGADRVEVRQLLPANRLLAGQSSRLLAGTALLANRAVTFDSSLRPVLATGRLDLRAATLIAVLAAHGQVQLTALPQDPGEAAAGAPIRLVWLGLTAGQPSALLSRMIDALPAATRPVRNTSLADGQYALEWAPDLDVLPPVN